jgi:hypothetical protein
MADPPVGSTAHGVCYCIEPNAARHGTGPHGSAILKRPNGPLKFQEYGPLSGTLPSRKS